MTIEITLRGADRAVEDEAAGLLRDIGREAPERRVVEADDAPRRDPAGLIGVATLVLALPGAVLAALEIADRLGRRRLRDRIEAAKARLEAAGAEAELDLGDGRPVDLRRTPTDDVVDRILKG